MLVFYQIMQVKYFGYLITCTAYVVLHRLMAVLK